MAGCAGANLQCKDGKTSSCSCGDGSVSSTPDTQSGLALLEPTPQEARPYVTPADAPSPVVPTDALPTLGDNKPYVTPVQEPEVPNRGDAVPSEKPPEPYSAQGAPTKESVGQYQTPPKELPGFPDAVRDKAKTPFSGGKRARWRTSEGDILKWDYQHGKIEKYNKRGKHTGEYDPKTGQQTKPAEPGRKIEP